MFFIRFWNLVPTSRGFKAGLRAILLAIITTNEKKFIFRPFSIFDFEKWFDKVENKVSESKLDQFVNLSMVGQFYEWRIDESLVPYFWLTVIRPRFEVSSPRDTWHFKSTVIFSKLKSKVSFLIFPDLNLV